MGQGVRQRLIQCQSTAQEHQFAIIGHTLVDILGLLRQSEHRKTHEASAREGLRGDSIARLDQYNTAHAILDRRVHNEAQPVALNFAGLGQIAEIPLTM